MNILTWTPSESALIDKTFVLRPTNVGQGLFLCGQQPTASSPVTLRFICTFLVKTTCIRRIPSRTPYRRHRCLRHALYRLREVSTARFIPNCDWWCEINKCCSKHFGASLLSQTNKNLKIMVHTTFNSEYHFGKRSSRQVELLCKREQCQARLGIAECSQ